MQEDEEGLVPRPGQHVSRDVKPKHLNPDQLCRFLLVARGWVAYTALNRHSSPPQKHISKNVTPLDDAVPNGAEEEDTPARKKFRNPQNPAEQCREKGCPTIPAFGRYCTVHKLVCTYP